MESRFFKFISIKRRKTDSQTLGTTQKGALYPPAASEWPLPVPTPPSTPYTNNTTNVMLEREGVILQTIPYDTLTAGKAPIFSSQTVKGNGPVKLQTSRRLSSGEIVTTTQNDQTVMDDIREGEYIVGQRKKRDTRSQLTGNATPQTTSPLSTCQSNSNASWASRPLPETPSFPGSPSLDKCVGTSTRHPDELARDVPPISSDFVSSPQSHSSHWSGGVADSSSDSRSRCTSTATSSSIPIANEQNATIAALLKAEYSRLAELYGRDGIECNTPQSGGASIQTCVFPIPPSKGCGRAIEVALDPLPYPNMEKVNSSTRRSSNTSAASSLCHDDNSDASSNKRVSLTSSCATSSSHTVQTTVTDHDAVVTRHDIRKIVDEMRSTYLQALETRAPLSPRSSHTTRKKRRTKLGASVVERSVKQLPPTPERQTWHGNNTDATHTSRKQSLKTRAISQPAPGFGRLSPVEASPPPSEKRPTERLQRADSTTLGSIMAKIGIDEHPAEFAHDNTPLEEYSSSDFMAISYLDDAFTKVNTIVQVQDLGPGRTQPAIPLSLAHPAGNFF